MQLTDRNGSVIYFPQMLHLSQNYFNRLKTACCWQTEEVQVFGKWHKLRRQTAWYGTADYRYAGQIKTAQPWLPVLREIKTQVEALTQDSYSGVLLNYYPDGLAGMGWHADNERDLATNAAIASVSFGATRRFDLRHQDGETLSINLEDGSILIMAGEFQEYWKHQLPIQRKVKAPRINLTFRVMMG
ncbi:MAG: alpha-ketoglutarate-dependent dioxygenase AlkB [Acaryochloris sp. RU_4_1]|nr:alpha-ketoglutarate-dependent dioxygenase AlkB [Acaryochloris sp. RU_4_1]NJR56004.1 alpha-ketoglutarate-dependent dioxygenase AlkB [Acaryochloris sp. CRU_2_0]